MPEPKEPKSPQQTTKKLYKKWSEMTLDEKERIEQNERKEAAQSNKEFHKKLSQRINKLANELPKLFKILQNEDLTKMVKGKEFLGMMRDSEIYEKGNVIEGDIRDIEEAVRKIKEELQ